MKKNISFKTKNLWEKTKRAFYTLQILAIIAAVPVLGFLEMSHTESKKTEPVEQNQKTLHGNAVTGKQNISVGNTRSI